MEKADLKKIATSREMILFSLVSIFFVFMFYRIACSPNLEEIESLKEKKKTVQLEKKGLQMEFDALKLYKQKKEKSEKKSSNIRMDILSGKKEPEINDVASFLKQITAQQFQQGITLDSLSYDTTTKGSGYSKTPFNLKVSGPFNKITSFMEKIDQLSALVSLDSIYLGSDKEQEGEMELEIIATFYQMEGLNASM